MARDRADDERSERSEEEAHLLVGDESPERIEQHSGGETSSSWLSQIRALASRVADTVMNNGRLLIVNASLSFATAQLLVKVASRVQTFEIVAFRSVINCALSIWVIRRGGHSITGKRSSALFLAGRGFMGMVSMTAFYLALTLLPLGDVSSIFFMNPVVVALVSWLILGETPTWNLWAGMGLCLLGVALVSRPAFLFGGAPPSPSHTAGVLWALLAALASGAVFVMLRFLRGKENANTIAFWFHFSSLLASVPFVAIGVPKPAVWPNAGEMACLLGVTAGSFWGQVALTRGFQLIPAGEGAAINTIQVVAAFVYGTLILGEPLTAMGVTGALAIVVGAVTVNARGTPGKDAKPTIGEAKNGAENGHASANDGIEGDAGGAEKREGGGVREGSGGVGQSYAPAVAAVRERGDVEMGVRGNRDGADLHARHSEGRREG